MKELAPKEKTANFVFSPFSCSTVYGMTELGARGKTRAQLLKLSGEGFVDAIAADAAKVRGRNSSYVKLNVGNYVITGAPNRVSREYISQVDRLFQAKFCTSGDTSQLADSLVDKESRGLLHRQGSALTPDSLILLNTVYLKACWADAFVIKATTPEKFTCGDGSVMKVPTMHKYFEQAMKYCCTGDCEAVRLPYGSSDLVGAATTNVLAMYVILPKAGSASDWLCRLNDDRLLSMIKAMSPIKGELDLPRFQMQTSVSLKAALERQGVTDAFSSTSADLSGVAAPPCWIGDIRQTAKLVTNEEGTEAAAETEAIVYLGFSNEQAKEFNMKVDRPFVFIVRDDSTGSVLFAGLVNKPVDSVITPVAQKKALLETVKELSASYEAGTRGSGSESLQYRLESLGYKLLDQKDYADALKLFQMLKKHNSAYEQYSRQITECEEHLLGKKQLADFYQKRMNKLLDDYLGCNGHKAIGGDYLELAVKRSAIIGQQSARKAKLAAAEFLYRQLVKRQSAYDIESDNRCQTPAAKRYLGAPAPAASKDASWLQNLLTAYIADLRNSLAVNRRSLAHLRNKMNRDPHVDWCIGNIWIYPDRCSLSGVIESQQVLAGFLLNHGRASEAVPLYEYALANATYAREDDQILRLLRNLTRSLRASNKQTESVVVQKQLATIQLQLNEQTRLMRTIESDYKPREPELEELDL